MDIQALKGHAIKIDTKCIVYLNNRLPLGGPDILTRVCGKQ